MNVSLAQISIFFFLFFSLCWFLTMSIFPSTFCIIFLVLLHSPQTLSHTKGIRPGTQLIPFNRTRTELAEQQFMKWVRFVGTLKHSIFSTAKNKVSPSYTLVVDKNPSLGDFTTIQDAIDSLPSVNLVRVIIRVNAGIYKEKVSIPSLKDFITIQGAGADVTVVQWGDTAETLGPRGQPIGTYSSATFAVNSRYFLATNITFKNTAPVPPAGAIGKQAVAFRATGDTAAFLGCKFLGAQDTLYDHLGRHYYKDCYIEGSVDFIFGNGLSLYEGCHVHAIAQDFGALTAQGRNSAQEDSGFSFVNCKVSGSGVLYLGRAWGSFSRVVFAYTYMDNIIIPSGWNNWGDPSKELIASSSFSRHHPRNILCSTLSILWTPPPSSPGFGERCSW
eukprot:TRINITY_DN4610_c0_g2_i3.p1 TRINITY_DN4610_c0_g2~~TRINITY_DN4610_c0_g2_i3.p1  ORF type:complete len:389 (-),score=48.41 TRINITY_DN4610_c0_g2_i3:77-1243(-)